MKLELNDLPAKIAPLLRSLKRYLVLILFVSLLGMYSFLVYQINALTNTEPSEEAIAEKLKTVQRPRIDEDAINKMQELQDQNIEVETLFKQARDNPFNE